MRHTSLRGRLFGATAALAATALVVATPGVADAATTRNRADAAAGWLGRQLDDDTRVMVGQFGPDYGLTADVVLALHSAKVGKVAARRATRALRAHVLDYTGGGDPAEFYAGSYAKLLLLAAVRGIDPRLFGGGDRGNLVANLRALECGTRHRSTCPASDDGRFSDVSQFGDFSNTVGQSLALIGLERGTRQGPSRAAVAFLVGQQCANGGFPESFGATTCSPSVDATGFAVQALSAVPGAQARDAAFDGGRWLKQHQHRNGSFTGNDTRNANSTALAAQALTAVGRSKAAAQARHFLRVLQVECWGTRDRRGMVRYDRAGSGDAARATSQAVPALARTTLADITRAGTVRGLPRLGC